MENKENQIQDIKNINALKLVSNEVSQNIITLQNNNATIVEKKEKERKHETIKKIKKDVVARFKISQKPIDSTSYKTDGNKIFKRFSVFSTLDILNKNSDLFHYTKNSLNTIFKTIYSSEEIKDLMEKTNSHSFDNLISKLEKAMKHPTKGMHINNVANNVVKFISELKSGKEISFEEKNTNDHVNSQLQQFENGPAALVSRISSIYGDNRYYNKINAYIKTLTPLFVKFENEKEADDKIYEIEQYIKQKYNYSFQYDNKIGINKITRTIKVAKYRSKMDSCVNMLYSVAKNLKGSQKTNIKMARKLLNKNESNDFLTKKNALNNYIGVKYTVVDKEQKIKKIFKAHSDTISDIVSTLTTAFMARFVFDSKYYAEIERDLTEQAANKMKYLSFSKDSNEDYWINQLIQERLKLNIAQVCAANNITDANQLVEIYNNNGTVIVNPERINSIDDLVFALQYSVKQKVENKALTNLAENNIIINKKLKNNKNKVKPYVFKKEKPNKYLEEIKNTDFYKECYAKYKNQLESLSLDLSTIEAKSNLEEIKNNTNKNLEALNDLAKKSNLSEEDTNMLIDSIAANDAVGKVVEENESILNQSAEETKPDEEEVLEIETNQEIEDQVKNNDFEKAMEEIEIVDKTKLKNDNIDKIIPDAAIQLSIDDIEVKEEPVDDVIQLSLFDERFVNEVKQRELEELNKPTLFEIKEGNLDKEKEKSGTENSLLIIDKTTVFKTQKKIKDLNDEELKKKIAKFFYKTIHGANGKVGVVGQNLNYRIIEKKTRKYTSVNDSERLDDPQFKKANKIRDAKINLIIDDLTDKTIEYFNLNKEILTDDITISKLCNKFVKYELNYAEDKAFTLRDMKNCLSVLITESVNPELKFLNLELYTGKKTYKNYHSEIANLIKGE